MILPVKTQCRRHRRVMEVILDLGSKNGTFVGDEKILGSNTVTLANGMYITLGNEIFQFKI